MTRTGTTRPRTSQRARVATAPPARARRGGRAQAGARGDAPAPPFDVIEDSLAAIMRWARVRVFPRVAADAGVEIDRSGILIVNTLHRFGPMRLSDLAAYIGLDRSTISRQVAAVVRDGFVHRTGDARDARASQLALTARGQAARQKLNRAWRAIVRGLVADWSTGDQARLADLLGRLAHELDADPAP